MNYVKELLSVDSEQTFNFFFKNLQDVIPNDKISPKGLAPEEVMYVAYILAHYAQTSRSDTSYMPVLADLTEVFEEFILKNRDIRDPVTLETAGAQTLLYTGFFRDQMKERHNVRWFDEHGQSFYAWAAHLSRDVKKRNIFARMSQHFPAWAIYCRNLNRTFQENALILQELLQQPDPD